MKFARCLLIKLVIVLFCFNASAQHADYKLELINIHAEPVIGKRNATDNRFGFEGGSSVKLNGYYYIFITEVYDTPKTAATRLALWKSKDGINFEKIRTIAETNRDWNDTTHRMSPWAPNVVYDEQRKKWSVFHVGYRRKANSSNVFNMSGRIFRFDSQVSGKKGIEGPYEEGDWLNIEKKPDWWEGPGEIVSFYPFKIKKDWYAFYGGNSVPEKVNTDGTVDSGLKNIFYAGLLKSTGGLTAKWIRQSHLNPVLIDSEFVENSVVTQISPNLFINLFDGNNKQAISYSISSDGITWGKEKTIELHDAPVWIKNTRTPLGLLDEGNGIYSIYFTAFDGSNSEGIEPLWHDGFGNIGVLKVKLLKFKSDTNK